MKLTRHNDEVYYASEDPVRVNRIAMENLKESARKAPRRRCRLCTHPDTDDPLHEMLIVHERDVYVRPHKHLGKSESFHIIEGAADVVLLDDEGRVCDVIRMGEYVSGAVFYYRLSKPLFHTLFVRSPIVVFHECTNGPFRREDTVFAPWSPDESDPAAVRAFMKKLSDQVAALAGGGR